MRNSEEVERGQGVTLTSLRRAFLIDMSWPVGSDAIARLFDLPAASAEVLEAEVGDSRARMGRFTRNGKLCAILTQAARDCEAVLSVVEDEDERVAWLATYALAVMNLLEMAGEIEVTAA
jgi:aminoglycoside phosphotransferase